MAYTQSSDCRSGKSIRQLELELRAGEGGSGKKEKELDRQSPSKRTWIDQLAVNRSSPIIYVLIYHIYNAGNMENIMKDIYYLYYIYF
jgi:hypothetical protein